MKKTSVSAEKIVIAHRGASGYLPEHTLAAKAMAHAMGAHYVEQDVVMTKDDALIVLHDITLDRTTDVAEKFPGRVRDDGRYYAIDFTLEEVRSLAATEAFVMEEGKKVQGYKNRFPINLSSFSVPTLEEEIQLIQGLNKSTGKDVGIYPEIKQPKFHRDEGKDISTAVVKLLKEYGYFSRSEKVFLQTFSFEELKEIRTNIFPEVGVEIDLILLVGNKNTYPWIFEEGGMEKIAKFADGIGPDKGLVIFRESTASNTQITPLVSRAHAAGLKVHPYTYRLDTGQIPNYADNFDELLRKHFLDADVDGIFTDFPDKAVKFLQRN
ncbi:glycerophosphodiester phosphodiesterase [Gammaproteobacteria bacterium]|nr:glycerophosphodiester phosphodiesterase [Gammaproteobacteria bacterium]|tara:strand:- start:849 stop:1820 length:972 start_codon:yes stop_codon:yes gene_type:complete